MNEGTRTLSRFWSSNNLLDLVYRMVREILDLYKLYLSDEIRINQMWHSF